MFIGSAFSLSGSAKLSGVERGFTMVELLAVVAMIGILSTLAMVGYRQYISASKTADARAIMSAIRVAEESYRAETLQYLSCSPNINSGWYPASPDGKKRHWVNPNHAQSSCWRTLNVVTDSPTTFGFTVRAGSPGQVPPTLNINPPTAWNWPTTTEPWYVIQAVGNADGDSVFSRLVASSFSGDIYSENETE